MRAWLKAALFGVALGLALAGGITLVMLALCEPSPFLSGFFLGMAGFGAAAASWVLVMAGSKRGIW